MPRVCLTEAQRREAAAQKAEKKQREAIDNTYRMLAGGLAAKKSLEGLRNEDLGAMLGMNRHSVARFLRCKDIQLPVETVLKIIYALGLEVKEREKK